MWNWSDYAKQSKHTQQTVMLALTEVSGTNLLLGRDFLFGTACLHCSPKLHIKCSTFHCSAIPLHIYLSGETKNHYWQIIVACLLYPEEGEVHRTHLAALRRQLNEVCCLCNVMYVVFAIGRICKDRQHPHNRLMAVMEKKILIPVAWHPCLILEHEHENT